MTMARANGEAREKLGPAERIIQTAIAYTDHLYHGRPGVVVPAPGDPVGVRWSPVTHKLEGAEKVVYQLVGAVYAGNGRALLCYFPDEAPAPDQRHSVVEMTHGDWQALIRQTDLLETEVLAQAPDGTLVKVIVRKGQRTIDQATSWRVYRRDGFRCRYCASDGVPLTVDHLVRWEEGGPSTEENLVACCRKCNRVRGDMPYAQWLLHPRYAEVSRRLDPTVRAANEALAATLGAIPRVVHVRAR